MVFGCGLSNKTNKKTGTLFQYFWWYEDGKKHEKYLGKSGSEKVNQAGIMLRLAYYRKYDQELHKIISELAEKSETTIDISPRPESPTTPTIQTAESQQNYIPETEE